MKPWPRHPVIYEINTWVWLQELGKGNKSAVTLATVPQKEWDGLFLIKQMSFKWALEVTKVLLFLSAITIMKTNPLGRRRAFYGF